MARIFWVQRKYGVYLSLFGFSYVWISGVVLARTAPVFWESLNWLTSFILYAWAPVDVCLAYSSSSVKYFGFSMDNHFQSSHRSLKILSHNIRGINSDIKWNSLRNNILESNCDIVCIQETKKESFDDSYIRLFCNHYLDKFALGPSIGASGGFIIIWKGSLFEAEVVE
jgi:hypothetical protein